MVQQLNKLASIYKYYKKVGKFHCYLLLSLQEKVRNIFKKYGLTISAVVLAFGKGLKSVAKGI